MRNAYKRVITSTALMLVILYSLAFCQQLKNGQHAAKALSYLTKPQIMVFIP